MNNDIMLWVLTGVILLLAISFLRLSHFVQPRVNELEKRLNYWKSHVENLQKLPLPQRILALCHGKTKLLLWVMSETLSFQTQQGVLKIYNLQLCDHPSENMVLGTLVIVHFSIFTHNGNWCSIQSFLGHDEGGEANEQNGSDTVSLDEFVGYGFGITLEDMRRVIEYVLELRCRLLISDPWAGYTKILRGSTEKRRLAELTEGKITAE